MKAVLRGIRIAPSKANLVAGIVRGKPVKEAMAILKFMPKKAAKIISKVIRSAASNAKNNFQQSYDDLIVSQIWAVKGPVLKRATPANRGRMWPILERTSHIHVEVGYPEGFTPPAPKKVTTKKSKKVEEAEVKTEELNAAKATEAPVKTEKKAKKVVKKKEVK